VRHGLSPLWIMCDGDPTGLRCPTYMTMMRGKSWWDETKFWRASALVQQKMERTGKAEA
jgi:hypothetical protein